LAVVLSVFLRLFDIAFSVNWLLMMTSTCAFYWKFGIWFEICPPLVVTTALVTNAPTECGEDTKIYRLDLSVFRASPKGSKAGVAEFRTQHLNELETPWYDHDSAPKVSKVKVAR